MKKATLISCLLLATLFVKAQQPKDTTRLIPIHYTELIKLNQQLQRAQALYHRLDIPALKRDTLDSYLQDVYYFLNRRAVTAYADTVKKKK